MSQGDAKFSAVIVGAVSMVAFLLVVTATLVRISRVYHVPVPKDTSRFGLCDFHNAVYFPGLAFSRGENPYSADYAAKYPVNREMSPYSPMLLPFCAVLGRMPLRIAEGVWVVLNLLACLAFAYLLLRIAGVRVTLARVLTTATLVLLTRAGHSNMVLGQFGFLFAIATILAVRCGHKRPTLAAIALAFATMKPTFGFPLVMLMFYQRRYRELAIGLCLAATGALISVGWIYAFQNTEVLASFQASHAAIVVDSDVDPESAWMRTDVLALLSKAIGYTPTAVHELLFMCLVLVPAGLLLRRLSFVTHDVGSRELESAIVFLAIPMCIYHLVYDALIVLPVVVALLCRRIPPWRDMSQPLRSVLLVLLVTLMINYLATWSIMSKLGIDGMARTAVVSINGAALFAANVLLWIWGYRRSSAKERIKKVFHTLPPGA